MAAAIFRSSSSNGATKAPFHRKPIGVFSTAPHRPKGAQARTTSPTAIQLREGLTVARLSASHRPNDSSRAGGG